MYQKSTIIRYQKNWYQIACQTRQKPVPVLWHRFLAQISGMFVISFNFFTNLTIYYTHLQSYRPGEDSTRRLIALTEDSARLVVSS